MSRPAHIFPVPSLALPWSRRSGAKAARLTPSFAASRKAIFPTLSIRSSESESSSPRPTSRSILGLIESLGGVSRSVSSSSPPNSPRLRSEAMTPPSFLSSSTAARRASCRPTPCA